MSYRGRELEVKLLYHGALKLHELNYLLLNIFKPNKVRDSIYATSSDIYWALPEGVPGQFIRARNLDGQGKWQITVKGIDRGTSQDRIEREVLVSSSPVSMLRAAHGAPVGELTKSYYTHWFQDSKWANLSCYIVHEAPELGIVIEVESDTIEEVWEMATIVKQALTVKESSGSLYEMLLAPKLQGE